MKCFKKLPFLLILALLMMPLTGCAGTSDSSSRVADESESSTVISENSSEASSEVSQEESSTTSMTETEFSYSEAFDGNGYWEGITALDYTDLPEYEGISIPSDTHEIEDEEVQTQIDSIKTSYPKKVTDRAVEDEDTVNIDYVGSVDGVEFEGGSTSGAGTEVTIGVTSYIDDFLEQLIGHTPGETFNVEVTFPDDYSSEELQGKDAVFVTTINYISSSEFEVDDAYVSEYLSAVYEWTTVAEMTEAIREDLKTSAIKDYIRQYLIDNSEVETVPELLLDYQKNSMLKYYQGYADAYGLDMDDFLSSYVGYSTVEELIEAYTESNTEQAKYYLAIQAIAEELDIIPTDTEVEEIYADSYSSYVDTYGLPCLKQNVLCEQVLNRIIDNVVLA